MTRWKDVYHGTLEYFIYVLIFHVPVFHVLQLHNKLQKIDMSCFAHHLDIFFGLVWTCGLIIYASYIFNLFIYISYLDKRQYIVKNKCKIHKNTLLSVLQRHGLPLFIWIFISQVPSHFLTHGYPQDTTYAFICVNR
jgi:hypothetical protein